MKKIAILALWAFTLTFCGGSSSSQSTIETSKEEPESTVEDVASNQQDDFITVASYNVYILGNLDDKYVNMSGSYSNANIPQRVKNNAWVIAQRDLDLVVIQEVENGTPGEWVLKDLTHQLNTAHNKRYKWLLSPEIGPGFRLIEAIGFLYDSVSISTDANIDIIESNGSRDFARCSFESGDFDFTIIAGHLAWGNAVNRKKEYQVINDILQNPANYSADPDIIVLGDFNRFGDNQEAVKEIQFDASKMFSPNIEFWDKDFNVIEEVTVDLITGRVPGDDPQLLSTTVSNNFYAYDMIICTSDVMEEFGVAMADLEYNTDFGVVAFDHSTSPDFISDAGGSGIRDDWSDHRPIWVRFNTNTGQKDSN